MLDTTRSKLGGISLDGRIITYKALNYILDHPAALLGLAVLGAVIGVLWAPPTANPIDMIIAVATWALMAVLLVVGVCGLLLFASFAEITAEMIVDTIMPREVQRVPDVQLRPAESDGARGDEASDQPVAGTKQIVTPGAKEMQLMLSCMMETARWYSDQEEARGCPPIDKEIRLCCYLMIMDAMMNFNIDFEKELGVAFFLPYLQAEFPFAVFLMDEAKADDDFTAYLAALVRAEDEEWYPNQKEPYVVYGLATVDMVRKCTGRHDDKKKENLLLTCCARWETLYHQRVTEE